MRDQHRALLLAIVLLALTGCRRDKDNDPPVVDFLLPSAGSTVNIPDTITVRVAVSDDQRVESLTVLVTDQNDAPITASITTSVGQAFATVELELPVVSERVESGTYTLVARVSDGDQDGRAFQNIVIHAAPLRMRSVFVLPNAASSPPFEVTRIDSVGNASTWMTLSELGGATIDLDHLYTAGTTSQGLVRTEVNTGTSIQLLANSGVGTDPFFHGLTRDPTDGRTYVGTRDGWIRGFTPSGLGSFSANAPAGTYSEYTACVGERLVSIVVDPITAQRQMAVHASSSGALLTQFAVDNTPQSIYRRNEDHVLIFGNRNGDGLIQDRNVEQGGIFEMRVFPGEPIIATAAIGGSEFILARASGLFRFSYNTNSVLPLNSLSATALTFDNVSGSVLVGVGNQLITVDPFTGAQLDSRTLPTSVGSVLVLTNR